MDEIILADLARRYPDGYIALTRGGQRCKLIPIYVTKTGYSVNVNGSWHFYNRLGEFISGGDTAWPLPRPALPRKNHSSRGPVGMARLARGIARIEGRDR